MPGHPARDRLRHPLATTQALKNTLRQAPDVILIGEVRDRETMEAAITFADTGHLCLATLHSNNANQAIERIMNFFPVERHAEIFLQLSLNLRAHHLAAPGARASTASASPRSRS